MASLLFEESDTSDSEEFRDSEENFVYEVEDQRDESLEEDNRKSAPDLGGSSIERNQVHSEFFPYSDDPVADKIWTDQYNKEIEEEEERQQLKDRLSGRMALESWYVKFYIFYKSYFITALFYYCS